ncbi:MAG: methyltransferase domain-containing protein [Sulfurovum sp.]|nr:methyltransferase domain-containing protein [Sulfurovum sp.]MCB4745321.1 methyltransferase domain-containing protein [Sulfurovum sp.]MCB4746308.1 methyltransferase domain-containing protein [Sulfurovum sp.]MCB4748375.1 methyltransferase domain-containing protein [Sulfurovum sp.]MCB4748770.1 methyltransferase domain-containing protein [Sulfurovum sp.]
MKIQRAFSQNAKAYDQVNIIQKKVIQKLISKIEESPMRLLDIGCGNGTFYNAVCWPIEIFVGIDFAEGMLSLHPQPTSVNLLRRDFNMPNTFKGLESYHFDRIVSSSALQWATNLNKTLAQIAKLNVPVSFSIFTSNTFKTLHETAGLSPILRSKDEVISLLQKYFSGKIEILHYTLEFTSVREMFRYMKRSGVGASRNTLCYKEMKKLMREYPLHYLEYEVVILHEQDIHQRTV